MLRSLCFRCFAVLAGLALAALTSAGLASASDKHIDGHEALRKGLQRDGSHLVHKTPQGHQMHAHVRGGKVRGVEVTHRGKKLAVKKFKSARRRHAMLDDAVAGDVVLTAGDVRSLTLFIGFGFLNQDTQQWVIIWFPIQLVDGGDQGAVDYNGGGDPNGDPNGGADPSGDPNGSPDGQPNAGPNAGPAGQPNVQPSFRPNVQPSFRPNVQPSFRPNVGGMNKS